MVLVSPPPTTTTAHMPKSYFRSTMTRPSFSDASCFLSGAFLSLFLVWSFSSYFSDPHIASSSSPAVIDTTTSIPPSDSCSWGRGSIPNLRYDPDTPSFYDDANLSYILGQSRDRMELWDVKKDEWLNAHPSFIPGARERILLVTGSQPLPCKNPIGDHLLLRFFKNKVDYCRIHGCEVFYNNVLLQPKMFSFWAKYAAVHAAMLAHPEAEWIWWVDSDAVFTDMDFSLPLKRYQNHNLVVHGWPSLVFSTEGKSWTSINAGVFLIRNCQWSMDFLERWAGAGPQGNDYEQWGMTLRNTFKDKIFPESDDQAMLIYLILENEMGSRDKVFIEDEYYFEGYWEEILESLQNVTERQAALELEVAELRRRHAEKVSEHYGELRHKRLRAAGDVSEHYRKDGLTRPFVTHFTGCQPCSGNHNKKYSGESCWDGMVRALNFADNQVLRKYGFVHPNLLDSAAVTPTPFEYPVVGV
ncbi:hypothetical protein MLD38_028990 [Melastoma candidum]|uniref:Uncharacterized protein n=1 Tax=Melastoma candidum TaxID=119954 RepID=A0ACB9N2C7_9MYRT|nr:hypothetical protein MLD38_028990 [Melastoma candidum]